MSAIELGMFVICIRKKSWVILSGPPPRHGSMPVFGKIYKVAKIETCESGPDIRDAHLLGPGEVFLGFRQFGDEILFRSRNFIAVNPAGFVELPSREPAEIKG